MLYELRRYRTFPGQRERWVQLMDEEIIPLQVQHGMVVVGSFLDEKEPDVYIWLRRFNDEEERRRLYKEVYGGKVWTEQIAPKLEGVLDQESIEVVRMQPTSRSVLQ